MTKEGTVLDGKYEILAEVGRGGMSIVYLARDKRLNKQWAVKEIKNDGKKSAKTLLKGLEREANILKNVDHPVLPRIVDIINQDGTIYVVMDYIEGDTIQDRLKKEGAQPQELVVEWGLQLASALNYLHNMNPPVIYRDMKPSNVMIKPEGGVKLIDFGTAKEYEIENNADTTALGTRGYAAPEQFGDSKGRGIYNTDARTDIYNLGATLYHIVTGKNPCEPPYEIKPIREWNPMLSSGLEKIILKCTQKNADRRYQTIGDLLADLRRSLVHPDEDFVVIAPLVDNGKTKVISGEELKQIKEHGVEPKEDRHASKLESSYDPDEDEDDEDENEGLSPKMDKAMTIMGIVVFVVILAVIIYLVGSFFGLFRFGSNSSKNTETQTQTQTQTQTESEQPVMVQNVCGKLQEEAQSELEAQGLYMFVIQEQKSDQPEGTVLNQDPVGGSEVSAGTTINVIVAGTENVDFTDSESQSEQNDVPVPNVVGKLEKDASSTLSAAGFKVSKTYKYDDSVDAGKVVSQSPRGGNAQEGSTVTIVISQGKKSSTVPSVQGHSKKDAQAALQKAGLKVAVKEEYSDSVKAGQVISQSVASGKIVPADTTVTITVSKGPEEINYSYKFSKSYAAPEGAVSATYTLTGSDGTTYASGTSEVDGSLTIGASDMACESGKVTITWSIEEIDDEGLSDTSTKTETHSVSFSKQ